MGNTKKNIQLTISLLASNRLDTLPRCLNSIKSIMEAIPSELILVDTSNNPQVHELLLQYTDKVYNFEWCNDFSKARNVGLKKAQGEWFLYLDDDEWFMETDELIKFFRSGEYKQYGCANYQVRNYYDKNYVYYSDSWVSRMIKLDKGTEFRSKIHEYLYPSSGRCKNLDIIVGHSGYIFASKEAKEKHFQRNVQLLLDMIEQEPEVIRWKVQLIQEFRGVNHWEEMLKYSLIYLKEMDNVIDKQDLLGIGTYYMGALESHINLKSFKEGIELAKVCLEDKRSTDFSKAMTYNQLAELYLKVEDFDKSEACIQKYKEMQKLFEVETVDVLNQKSALLVGEAYDEVRWKKAHSILIWCDLMRKSTEYLHRYYHVLEWDKQVLYVYKDIEKTILKAIAEMDYEPIFSQVLTHMMKNKELRRLTFIETQEWETRNKEGFEKILYAMSFADGNDWYIAYARVLTQSDENREIVIENIRHFLDTTPNIFAPPERVQEVMRKWNLFLADFYEEVSFDKWKLHMADFLSKASEKQIQDLQMLLQESHLREDVRYHFLEVQLLLNKMREVPTSVTQLWEYRQTLRRFMEQVIAFYEPYYQDEIFLEYQELLPAQAQAACWILKYMEKETVDIRQAFADLETAATVYPVIASGIKRYIHLYLSAEQILTSQNNSQE